MCFLLSVHCQYITPIHGIIIFVEFISLIFLPIIMVGQRIMGRAGRIRAHEDHLTLQKMVKETQEELALLREHVTQKKEDPLT